MLCKQSKQSGFFEIHKYILLLTSLKSFQQFNNKQFIIIQLQYMRKFILKTPKEFKHIKLQEKQQIDQATRSFLSSRIGLQNIQQLKRQVNIIKQNNQQQKKHLHQLFNDQLNVSQVKKHKQPLRALQFSSSQLQSYEDSKKHKSNKKQVTEPIMESNIKLSKIIQSKSRKTNNYLQTRPKFESKNQYSSKYSSKEIYQKLRDNNTSMNEDMSKKQNFKIKKMIKIRQLKQQNQIQDYHKQIYTLQDIYELLSTIISNIRMKDHLLLHTSHQYIKLVNSQTYDFIDEFIEQSDYKIKKILRMSKILQFLSIMYFLLEINKKNLKQHYENLINSIGHSASNQIFLAKLFIMSRNVSQKQQKVKHFESSIKQFQQTTFGKQISSQEDILVRMMHNNDTIQILQIKLGRSNFRFQNKIKDFLKLYQRQNYSTRQTFRYLLEFMAYYLLTVNLIGRIPFLETAPAPYLSKIENNDNKITIVIQPCNVLYYVRNLKYYIRSHTYEFLEYLTENLEVVFWTYQMPSQIQYLLDVIDPEQKISFKFYKYHCINQNNLLIKDLMRLGRNIKNILLIDFESSSYYPQNGIAMPWKGSEHDDKLMQLRNIIQLILKKNICIPDALKFFKQQLNNLKPRLKHRKKI